MKKLLSLFILILSPMLTSANTVKLDDIYYDRGQMMLQTAAYGTMLVIWGFQISAFYTTMWDTKAAMGPRSVGRTGCSGHSK